MADYNSNYTGQEIDEAVGNAPLVLHLINSDQGWHIDAQYADVLSAITAGRIVFLCYPGDGGSPMYVYAGIQDVGADTEKITFMSGTISDEERILNWVAWYKDGNVSMYTIERDRNFWIGLTPTSPDFSGTTDDTGAEALNALQNGKNIWFDIDALGVVFPATMFALFDTNNDGIPDSVSCGAIVPYNVSGQDVLIKIVTSPDASQTYSTTIYPLTPMST